ncbi:MAG: cyanophycinase [Saprospiraceae bacterium]
MIIKNFLILFFLVCGVVLTEMRSQDHTSFITGDSSDVVVPALPAYIFAGGGKDNDFAMKWMLSRASGGDVLVLRASGSDGYNEYFYKELGISINSVETILFNNKTASSDPYIIRRMEEAEIIFIAGGDQGKYYDYWKDTPVGNKLAEIIQMRKKIIGGTSAGMMILGGVVYAPVGDGVKSEEALSNPYHPNIEEIRYDVFGTTSLFDQMIFDSHFDNRNRSGRLMTFLARAAKDKSTRLRAIACNESTVVAIDQDNIARVFGTSSQNPTTAYFLEVNCENQGSPQSVEQGMPLHWTTEHGNAVIVQIISCSQEDIISFDLKQWKSMGESKVEYWEVNNGKLIKTLGKNTSCK